MNFERYGGRRFLMCVGTQLLNAGLLVSEKLTDGSYLAITLATVGAYIAANNLQKRDEMRARESK